LRGEGQPQRGLEPASVSRRDFEAQPSSRTHRWQARTPAAAPRLETRFCGLAARVESTPRSQLLDDGLPHRRRIVGKEIKHHLRENERHVKE